MRRRRVLALGAAAAGFPGCIEIDTAEPVSTPVRSPGETPSETERPRQTDETTSIGGSLNGRPYRIEDDLDLIERSNTEWIHAFLDVRKKFEQDEAPADDPDIIALRRASRETDFNLIVSLKWNFSGLWGDLEPRNLPPSGSPDERALTGYAAELLDAIGEPLDIVVLGNEPVWETLDEDLLESDPPLIPFTRTLKERLISQELAGDPRFFLGAFNRLYDSVWEKYQDFYFQLFEMARNDDDVDGIDLHVHYYELFQAESMLDVARREFPDGTITATEFSPIFRYDDNVGEPITAFEGGEQFADRYGISDDTTVTEYLEAAKDDRLSREEAAAFMEAMPWYNVNFVEDMHSLLNEYDVEVGTFGFLVESDVRHIDWTEGWTAFPINCLFQPALIDTEDGAHPHYLDDFRDRV